MWLAARPAICGSACLGLPCPASAFLGFAVNIATFLVIKTTNSVTLKVLGTARNAGLVLVSSWLYHEAITPLEAAGYGVSLLCFFWYNYAKVTGK